MYPEIPPGHLEEYINLQAIPGEERPRLKQRVVPR